MIHRIALIVGCILMGYGLGVGVVSLVVEIHPFFDLIGYIGLAILGIIFALLAIEFLQSYIPRR